MSVITISRQSGSEGNQIVRMLCERLGYQYFDKHLMAQLAAEKGLDSIEITDLTAEEHHVKSFWEEAFSNMAVPQFTAPWALTHPYQTQEEMTVRQVSGFIHAAYQHGNIVIVGRGSQVVLKEKADVLHVRIVAPLERRIARWMAREKVSHKEAGSIVKERDHQHIDFVQTYFDEDVNDPELYDLIINTDKLSLEAAVDLIIEAARSLGD
jgi:cytidylate kinase